MRRKKFFRVPIANFASNAHTKPARVKAGNRTDARFLSENTFPKTVDTFADASNGAEPGDDHASSIHAVTLFVRAST